MYAWQRSTDEVSQETPAPTTEGVQDFGSNQDRQDAVRNEVGGGLLDLAEQTGLAPTSSAEVEPVGETTDEPPVPGIVVLVVINADGSAERMHDDILRGPPFLFSEADVRRTHQEGSGLFYLTRKGSDQVATPTEVLGWGEPGKSVRVPISGAVVASIFAFKHQVSLSNARDGLPADLGNQLSALLVRALGGDSTATEALAALAKSDPQVKAAVLRFSELPDSGGSAMVQLAAARLLTDGQVGKDETLIGPPGEDRQQVLAQIRERIEQATKLAGGIDRAQAAALNQEAAMQYRRLGEERLALEREQIARMYESTAQERENALPWVSRSSPNQTTIGPRSKAGQALDTFYAENPALDPKNRDQTLRFELGAKADAIEPQVPVPVNGTTTVRRKQDGVRTSTRQTVPTDQKIEGNQKGLSGARTWGGAGNILQQYNLWIQTHNRMMDLAEKIGRLDRLKAEAKGAAVWGKPPPLEEILLARKNLDAAVGQNPPPELAAQVAEARRRLAFLEEASRAFNPPR